MEGENATTASERQPKQRWIKEAVEMSKQLKKQAPPFFVIAKGNENSWEGAAFS